MASQDRKSLFTFGSGDTNLLVSHPEGDIVANVSSHAMSLASPVWKKFIFPPWRPPRSRTALSTSISESDDPERNPLPEEPLDFREDDADALLLIFRIAHLDFLSVKKKLNIDELYNLAILCDKYDCVHLVKPWVEDWFDSSTRYQLEKELARPIFVSWSFGRTEIFTMAANTLLTESRTDEYGQLLDRKGQAIPEIMPPGIIEEIISLRRAAIVKLIDIPKRRIRIYTDDRKTLCRYNRPGCDAIIFGSLVRGLGLHDLTADMKPEDIHLSVTDVADIVGKLEIHPYYSAKGGVHDDCSTSDFASAAASVLSNIGSPVLESHIRHMEEQQKKLGGSDK